MQHTATRFFMNEAKMFATQRPASLHRKRPRPRDALSLRAVTGSETRALPPSKTAAHCTRGCALSMAQRFFAGSGMTCFTRVIPVGSGGR